MAFLTRTADLLQDALEGRGDVDPWVSDLVPTAQAVASISVVVAPHPDFVSTLGLRLQTEAAALAQAGPAPGTRPRTESRGPVVVLVGRGVPRLLAGVAATVIAVGSVGGVAARSALPGQALYPVKLILDTAAVSLAGSDLDKGLTLLLQSEDRIHEASQLSDEPTAAAADVDTAVHGAIDGITRAQRLLLPSDGSAPDLRALLALQDFSARTMPRVEALRAGVPAGSLPLLSTLRGLLNGLSTNVTQLLASCTACGPAGVAARASLSPSVSPDVGAGPSTLPDLSATVFAGPSTGVGAASEPASGTADTGGTGGALGPGGTGGALDPGGTGGALGPGGSGGTAGRGTSVGTGPQVLPGVSAPVPATRGGGAGLGAPTVTGALPRATVTGAPPGATVTARGGDVGGGAVGGGAVGGAVGATLPGTTATILTPGVTDGTDGVEVQSGPVVSRSCLLGACR